MVAYLVNLELLLAIRVVQYSQVPYKPCYSCQEKDNVPAVVEIADSEIKRGKKRKLSETKEEAAPAPPISTFPNVWVHSSLILNGHISPIQRP